MEQTPQQLSFHLHDMIVSMVKIYFDLTENGDDDAIDRTITELARYVGNPDFVPGVNQDKILKALAPSKCVDDNPYQCAHCGANLDAMGECPLGCPLCDCGRPCDQCTQEQIGADLFSCSPSFSDRLHSAEL